MPSNLARQEFDYVALGHLHRYQNLNPKWLSCSCLFRISRTHRFWRTQRRKRFLLGHHHSKRVKRSHEFIKVATRPFIQIEVELNPDRDHTDQVIEAIEKYDVKDAVVKVVYHVPAGKKDLVHLHDVQRACGNWPCTLSASSYP